MNLFTKIASLDGTPLVTKEDMRELLSAAILYTTGIFRSADLKKRMSGYSNQAFFDLKDWLDGSEYALDHLKRATIYMTKYDKDHRVSAKFGVANEDVGIIREAIGSFSEDQLVVLKKKRFKKNALIQDILKDPTILRYCKALSYSKLRFITAHDAAIYSNPGSKNKLQPVVNDLMEEASRALLVYSDFSDRSKLLNYTKRCVHNAAIRLIEYQTAAKRARLRKSGSSDREFDVTVISMGDEDFVHPSETFESRSEARLTLEELKTNAALGPLVRAALGEDTRFELYLVDRRLDRSKMTEVELVKEVKRYLGRESKYA